MGDLGSPYRQHRVGRRYLSRGYEASYFSDESVFDWSRDLSEIAPLCCDVEGIAKACGFASATNEKAQGGSVERAVYVIGVEGLPVCKIGVSSCPTARLAELQGAHWANLSIHALLWFPTRKSETVEQGALRAATEMECRLNGEWVAMDAPEALELVLKSARHFKVPACDSATWMRNWNKRLDALREQMLVMGEPMRRVA